MDLQNYGSLAIFNGLAAEEISAMMSCLGAYTKQFAHGDFVFLEQEAVNYVGFILSGAVHMIKESEDGNKGILIQVQQGSLIGESYGIVDNGITAVSFQASSPCTIMFLPVQRVFNLCNPKCRFHNQLIQNIAKLVTQKNVKLIEKVEIMSKKTLRDKILTYLRIEQHGRDSFEIPFGRVELAEYLAVDRSSLTRELGNMEKAGLIEFHKNRFRLL